MTRTRAAAAGMALALIGMLVLATAGWAHGVPGKDKLTERELRRVETRLLGPEHAADHARVRARARVERARLARLTPAQRRAERRRATVRARAAQAGPASSDGRWNGSSELPMSATHMAMLPTGKVLMFAQPGNQGNDENESRVYLYEPRTGSTKEVRPPLVDGRPANIWCAGQTLMADGQVLVTGGNLRYQTGPKEQGLSFAGLDQIWTFDPWSESWTRQPDMEHGRWYPTQTLLGDGRTVIVGGWDESGREIDVPDIEVFTPAAQRGGRGSLARFPGYGAIGGLPTRPSLYPHMFLMPNGQVVGAGPRTVESFLLDVPRGGAPTARALANFGVRHEYGSSVLVPRGPGGSSEVMQVGGYRVSGRDGSTARSETLDAAANRVSEGPALRTARAHHNVVLLPDRSMVSVGGGFGDVSGNKWVADDRHKTVEILDRGAGQWRLGPAQTQKRSYHSTALLLPDGRVLSAGDESDATPDAVDVAEIYEPAYLHKAGERPQITGAPDATPWGRTFAISTSTGIDEAVLVAPGAVTHALDMSQRLVPLQVKAVEGGAELVAPPNANVAPPGFYMLFALKDGKPSVAHWVYVGAEVAPATTPTSNRPVQGPPAQPDGSGPDAPGPEAPGGGSAPAPAPAPGQPATPRTPAAPTTPATPATPPVPGPAPTPPGGPAAPAPDRVAPTPRLRLGSAARTASRTARLPLRLTLGEAGTVTVSARLALSPRARTIRIPRRGAQRVAFTRAGTRTVTLRLAAADAKRIRRGRTVLRVTLRATDRAGNARSRTVTLRL